MFIYRDWDCFTCIHVNTWQQNFQRHSEVDIQIQHKFSVEIEPYKRKFIAEAHTAPGQQASFHLFHDVRVFSDGKGYCDTCGCVHATPSDVDILFVGPSCKSISKEFLDRLQYATCYTTGKGTSGYTYVHGVRAAVAATSPALLHFENVLGVAEKSSQDPQKQSLIEAGIGIV